jgi:hypothetical protein
MTRETPVPPTEHGPESAASVTTAKVLTQIGLILTPAGLIALFCQVLDVSSRTTGVTSLAAVLLTSICVYRQFINRRVPASLLTALLVALAAVFFFNYQNILLKDTGLIKYYQHSNDFLSQIDGPISKAQEEIWFLGTDFNVSAGERRNLLLRQLAAGIKIRYLIFDPRSNHMEDLAADFDQSPPELAAECEKGLQSLLRLRKEWRERSRTTQSPGELSVRIFETHPHARFYVFDPARTKGNTFFVPYINSVNSPEVPGFLLENVNSGVFKSYFNGILKLWAESMDLNEYLQRHPEIAGQ